MSQREMIRPARKWRWFRLILTTFAVAVVLFFLLSFGGARYAYLFEIPFRLVTGWLIHLWNAAFPALAAKWRDLVGPLLCLAVFITGAHGMLVWLARGKRWKFPHTLGATSLFLLGCAAAIALSGVTHQAVWLGKGRIIRSNMHPERTQSINEMRQIVLLLIDYESDHGSFPPSLEALRAAYPETARFSFSIIPDEGPPEPFWYFPGASLSDNSARPMMASQIGGTMMVLKVDGSVATMTPEQLENILLGTRGK